MFVLYNILLSLLFPVWVPWMWLRSRARKEQPNWAERMGNLPLTPLKGGTRVWVHAVSVGEVVAAMPLLSELRREMPHAEIVLSVTTSSGHQTARDKAHGLYDHLIYFPIDVARFQLSAMQKVQPAVVAIMETELWMNFLWAAKVFDARTLLVNGRISDRSFPLARLARFFYQALLREMDQCLMQTELDASRIRELGAKEALVMGNVKFDQAVAGLDADPAEWRSRLQLAAGLPVIVVGSTRSEAEEDLVLQAIANLGVPVQVVHAPRHIEKAPALAERARSRVGSAALRSAGGASTYLVLDTYGELDQVYSVADVVVIGGGFEKHGGQNLIQPLAHGKPVLHGPYMHNFRDVAAASVKAGASRVCRTAEELTAESQTLLSDATARDAMAKAARELVNHNLGASKRYAQAIAQAAGDGTK